jgi:micrococcal nuclease
MRRRVRSRFPLVAVLVAALILLRLFTRSYDSAPFSFDAEESYRVQRVVDGDTLVLADGTRVRLLGVDTPETKHPDIPPEPLGAEASEFTRRHIEGRTVTLQFDRERRDRYHRVLAYVYLDDWMLNEELIRAGFSRAETRFPYSTAMKRRFRTAEKEARENNRGLWAKTH